MEESKQGKKKEKIESEVWVGVCWCLYYLPGFASASCCALLASSFGASLDRLVTGIF